MISGQTNAVVDATYQARLRSEVRQNHPTVTAAQARVRAAEAAVDAVRLWEDLTVGFSTLIAKEAMRRDDGDLMFSVEQTLPRPKLYQAQKAKASADRSVAKAETLSAAQTRETLVAQSVVELALAAEMLAIQTNQLTWLDSMATNRRVYKANTERARQQQAAAEREVEALERGLRSEAVAALEKLRSIVPPSPQP